ncbi:MAG TPA: ABC transporter permease [Acidimicrobiia bacterium]|nr:ABC transporter permease [Acidimicrobiia bacterium]
MSGLTPFLVAGIVTGSLYAITAMGLVLTYKTSGVFNFAHGALAAASAYLFYDLHTLHGLPWPVALVLSVAVVGMLGGALFERVVRSLGGASPASRIVATVGILLVIQGVATKRYGAEVISFPEFLPQRLYRIAGVNVGADQLISAAIAAAGAACLFAFFRLSRLGVKMRAVVDSPELLDLAGSSPERVRRQAWVIGNAFAAMSGVLLAPKIGLDAFALTMLVVQAFGAAAIGRFSSLPLTYLGALVVGVGGAVSTKYVADVPALAGFPSSFPFFVLFVVLLFTRKGTFSDRTPPRRVLAEPPDFPARWRLAGAGGLLVGLVAVPRLVGARLPVFTNSVIFMLIFLSLLLLVRISGQVSLCHAAFAAVGAVSFSHLAHGAGLPWGVALIGAGLVTVPVGAAVAVPAIRLSGLYLALATFGFGILLERMLFRTGLMFGVNGFRKVARPAGFATDVRYYYVCLAVTVVGAVVVYLLHNSRLGRLLRAMATSPVALSAHGLSVNVTRVLVFCTSAFLAGMAGALFAGLAGAASVTGFGSFQSLTWLTVLAIAGRGDVTAPVVAAAFIAVVPSYINNPSYTDLQPVFFGVAAVAAALSDAGNGRLRVWLRRATDRYEDRVRRSPVAERHTTARRASSAPERELILEGSI